MLRKTASLVLIVLATIALAAVSFVNVIPGTVAPVLAAATTLQSQRVTSSLIIDGDFNEWPSTAVLYLDASTAQYVAGTVLNPSDVSVSVFSVWNDQYLYLGADVTDDVLLADSSNTYDDDSIEIALDGDNDGACCSAQDHRYIVTVDRRLTDFATAIAAGSPPTVAVVMQPNGFRVEMAIPMSMIAATPGASIGLNVAMNDDDDGGRRDKRLVWIGNTTTDFANLGSLLLAGAVTPQPTRSPTLTSTPPTATALPTMSLTPTAAPSATPSATRSPTQTPTTAATPTRTPTSQATQPVDTRIRELEANLATLEARLRTILDVLQRAGRFPESARSAGQPATQAVTDPRAYVQGVNCGGPAYTAVNGDFYAADQVYTAGSWGYLSGQTAQVSQAIANTDDDTLYQTERYNVPGYVFDVPAGVYEVTLRFAETYQYAIPGSRVFDVKLQGETVIPGLEVLAKAGLYTALDYTFTATVSGSQLTIDFVAQAGQSAIKAIFVRGVGLPGPTPTPSASDRLSSAASKLTELEGLLKAVLDIFSTTQLRDATATPTATTAVRTPTATRTRTPTLAVSPTPTLTPFGTATQTSTPAPTATRTLTPTVTQTRTITLTPTITRTRTITPTPGTGPHTSPKKGLAGGDLPKYTAPVGASWSYDWYVAEERFSTAFEHVPMITGTDYDAAAIARVARAHPGSYWLIWNEPDYYQSDNIAADKAAQIYYTLRPVIKNADPTAKLIVGGVFNLNVQWLQDFRSAYNSYYGEYPVVEGWHVHHYQGWSEYNITTWRTKLNNVYTWMLGNGGLKELWVTEFGCLNSTTTGAQIMTDQIPWMEQQSWITRYAWYTTFSDNQWCPGCTGSLYNADDSLTTLGELYRSLP